MPTKTYQSYVNDLLVEFNEVELTTTADFDNAVGFHKFVKTAVNRAISDIAEHMLFKWPFLLVAGSVTLTIGDESEDKPTNCIDLDWESFYIDRDDALTFPDATKLDHMGVNEYERDHLPNAKNATLTAQFQKPVFVVRTRNNNFIFGRTKPDAAYTVRFKYFKAPTVLVATTDTTEIPDAFSSVILEKSLYYIYKHREEIQNTGISESTAKKKLQSMREILIPSHNVMRYSG